MEWDLRFAQANDALEDLRSALRLRSYLFIDKDRFQRGQRANTRSQTLISRTQAKVSASAEKYNVARQAMISLNRILCKVGWQRSFPELRSGDIRGLKESQETGAVRPSEGHRTLSWIWTRLGDGSTATEDEDLQEGNIFDCYT